MSSWCSPQSIYNLGHPAVKNLFAVPTQAQEKIDGSFFAFGVYEGELRMRSKGAIIQPEAPQELFKPAVEAVIDIQPNLVDGWQYRGECVAKPHHNSLTYSRCPAKFVILFDILTDQEQYLPYDHLKAEANRLGFEVVPQLCTWNENSVTLSDMEELLKHESVLGGVKVEGFVIKPLTPLYGPDKKMLFAKQVSEEFKEIHRREWKGSNPTQGDVIQVLTSSLATEARWNKGIQHLRELGELEFSPRDIGKLIREIQEDTKRETEDLIKDRLFKWAWPQISRKITHGVPEYYKRKLMEDQFDSPQTSSPSSNSPSTE